MEFAERLGDTPVTEDVLEKLGLTPEGAQEVAMRATSLDLGSMATTAQKWLGRGVQLVWAIIGSVV